MKIVTGKLLLAVSAALGMVGCAAVGPPRPPSLELPKPPTDLRAVRKGDKVLLTWTVPALSTDHQAVRSFGSTRICRGSEPVLKECGTAVGEAAPVAPSASLPESERAGRIAPRGSGSKPKTGPKIAARYSDAPFSTGVRPEMFGSATYAVEVLNANGRGAGLSNQVRVPLARTLPAPPDFGAEITARGVVLTWRSALVGFANPNTVSYVYRVYRRTEGGKANLVGEVPVLGAMNLSLTDSSIEWEQTYYFRVQAVTLIEGNDAAAPQKIEIEGDDSAEVKVFTHDVFPPAVPAELQAVFAGPGQLLAIDLVWAPVTDVDLAGYNVYRHEAQGAAVKVNGELVKTPAYHDASVVAGKTYSYSVSAVDVRGNESARSEEAQETVP
ncbi:MAG TPA: hypothetical protein VKR60_08820 [Candidatus Sulfotelmatobacter sp.]|nr:hypothetical protein [Candidatus Sulfotelmatobacter sp.]